VTQEGDWQVALASRFNTRSFTPPISDGHEAPALSFQRPAYRGASRSCVLCHPGATFSPSVRRQCRFGSVSATAENRRRTGGACNVPEHDLRRPFHLEPTLEAHILLDRRIDLVIVFTFGGGTWPRRSFAQFRVRVRARMGSNHSSVITGVSGTERLTDPCRLQPKFHSQPACRLPSSISPKMMEQVSMGDAGVCQPGFADPPLPAVAPRINRSRSAAIKLNGPRWSQGVSRLGNISE
jgi:hypothetical protein